MAKQPKHKNVYFCMDYQALLGDQMLKKFPVKMESISCQSRLGVEDPLRFLFI